MRTGRRVKAGKAMRRASWRAPRPLIKVNLMTRKLPFGLTIRAVLLGALVVVVFFSGTLWALNTFFPVNPMAERRPALTELHPLKPTARASTIVAPVAVATLAIRDVLEANAPRGLNGNRSNPLNDVLGKAEIGWTMARGPIAVAGVPPGLNISTTVNGSFKVTGQIATQTGNLTGAVTGILGGGVGQNVQKLTTRVLDQRADIRANVVIASRPELQTNWRISPNLSGNVSVAESGMTVAGVKLSAVTEIKPLLDSQVNEQIGRLSNQLRNDRTLELSVGLEWFKLFISI
jgi:hypothetical protein